MKNPKEMVAEDLDYQLFVMFATAALIDDDTMNEFNEKTGEKHEVSDIHYEHLPEETKSMDRAYFVRFATWLMENKWPGPVLDIEQIFKPDAIVRH